ncbi:MAG: homoserine O- acetyltransferase [Cirrosporium novae-zelandiae]|nr:MAG: homoserine O- acetyltransferase [Cirrosporium novae-zelandiae]
MTVPDPSYTKNYRIMQKTPPSSGSQKGQKFERIAEQPENQFAKLVPDQHIAIVPSFTLESGETLYNVPVAYTTKGTLSEEGNNAMVICHALSGSADVSDWWGPLIGGPGQAFDVTRFFVVCLNSLGSPYGSASPVTNKDGDPSKGTYGPEFPPTTIRDDVNIHRLILEDLGVKQIAAVIGGSMGGMLVLEYAYFGPDYVRAIIPIATSARHSAWGISWGEAQRQSIYSDPKYDDGYYTFEDPPAAGLGAARMAALLTYRSRDSFEARFGRNSADASKRKKANDPIRSGIPSNPYWEAHNDGNKRRRHSRPSSQNSSDSSSTDGSLFLNPNHEDRIQFTDPQFNGARTFSPPTPPAERKRAITYFSAQSYLRYQGEKFVKRFDSNCYLHITRKLDTHDVSRNRANPNSPTAVLNALSQIQQPTLVLGIESDGLFTFAEQEEIAAGIPKARLRKIESPEGHDAFLLQFEQVNHHILEFLRDVLPDIMSSPGKEAVDASVGKLTKSSTFGEAEVDDITACEWTEADSGPSDVKTDTTGEDPSSNPSIIWNAMIVAAPRQPSLSLPQRAKL